MDLKTGNLILDFVLVGASIWMLLSVRGLGGIVGRTLYLITIGAIILGFAHLIATLASTVLGWDPTFNNFIHRLIVLVGFVLVALGFRQVQQLT
jgi:hypothetical protein